MKLKGMYTEEMMQRAYAVSKLAHFGKDYGEHGSYFGYHVSKVATTVHMYCLYNCFEQNKRNAFAICAYLHDVVEDSDVSLDDIKDIFGIEIRDAVDALTRCEGESRKQNITRLKGNEMAHIVKKFDNLANYSQCLYDGDWERAKMYAELAVELNK